MKQKCGAGACGLLERPVRTPILCNVCRVEEDIAVGSRVVARVAVLVALRLVVGVSGTIVVVITMRRFPRVCVLAGLSSLAEGVFASFALP